MYIYTKLHIILVHFSTYILAFSLTLYSTFFWAFYLTKNLTFILTIFHFRIDVSLLHGIDYQGYLFDLNTQHSCICLHPMLPFSELEQLSRCQNKRNDDERGCNTALIPLGYAYLWRTEYKSWLNRTYIYHMAKQVKMSHLYVTGSQVANLKLLPLDCGWSWLLGNP